MKKERPALLLPAWMVLVLGVYSGLTQTKERDLSLKYREWLKLVSYIILPQEKEVFFKLTNDRDRDIFIESFWKQRDPTPGTPQNEFKEEHLKRFQYANTVLSRGTPREGWMTDMGRIHILLGPPVSIERFEATPGIYPCQVWYYYGDVAKKLPSHFALVFYQRGGAGEYKLYNPASDGPASLLIDTRGIDLTDYEKVYHRIRELAPTLAGVSISLIPGQYPYGYQPSPQNNIILANILESATGNVSPSYATHFLRYKGIVSTEYLTNYVESTAETALLYDSNLGIAFVHFAIVPKSMSVDYFSPRDQYYCHFRIDVSLRKDEEILYQYGKDFPFYFSPDRVETIKNNGICIQDSFPVIEGKYSLTVLLQNTVGKEFSLLEKEIEVGEANGEPKIVTPVVGYKLEGQSASTYAPFKTRDKALFLDPSRMIAGKEEVAFLCSLLNVSPELWEQGEIRLAIKGLHEKEGRPKTRSIPLARYPFTKIMQLDFSIPASELLPDYYEGTFELKNGKGETLDQSSSSFIVSPQEFLPHPVTLSKALPLSNASLYFYALAFQYGRAGNTPKAEAFFEKGFQANPEEKQGLVEYTNFLLKNKNYDRALELIERVRDDESFRFDYHLIKGKALEGQGKFKEAIASLLEGNKIYNSDTRLLNSLGFCYYRTGQKKDALEVLRASLRLNPDQREIRELIQRIEEELK